MRGGFGIVLLVLAVGAIARYAVWIGVAVAIALLLVGLWKFTGWLDRRLDARDARRAARTAELAALTARADLQNAWVLAGDERGVYGDYPPFAPG